MAISAILATATINYAITHPTNYFANRFRLWVSKLLSQLRGTRLDGHWHKLQSKKTRVYIQ
jgi:hypothetical protein